MHCHWKHPLALGPAAAWKQEAVRWPALRLLQLATLQGLRDECRSRPRCLAKASSPPQQGRATLSLTRPRLHPALGVWQLLWSGRRAIARGHSRGCRAIVSPAGRWALRRGVM